MSEAGRRQLNILAEHSRSSDLSDILEEEEEELCSDVLEEKWDLKEHCSRENGEKVSYNNIPIMGILGGNIPFHLQMREKPF